MHFRSKTEKNEYQYWILHIHISLSKFHLKLTILIFWLNLHKKVLAIKNRKSEHPHEFLHIWISLGKIFQLNLIICVFGPNSHQKWYFQSKTEQAVQGLQAFVFCVVNINIFKHFEDLTDLIIGNILKEKLVMPCLLGSFYLKIV